MVIRQIAMRSALVSALSAGVILASLGIGAAKPTPASTNGTCIDQPVSAPKTKKKETQMAQCCRRVGKSYQCGRG